MTPHFAIGDRIIVKPSSCEYYGSCVGKIGTITMIYADSDDHRFRYRVRLDKSINRNTTHGEYWFSQNSIEKQSLYFKKGNEKNMGSSDINYYVAALCGYPITKVSQGNKNGLYLPKIKNVIFNPPATIIFWQDDTKTVVKAVNEPYDPEKGLAMAISKKAFGNNQSYYSIFEKNLKKF